MSTALSSKKGPPGQARVIDPSVITRERQILEQLSIELTQVQKRLGTSAEKTGDCQLARDLGHAIRNKLHVLRLWGVLRAAKPIACDKNQLDLNF